MVVSPLELQSIYPLFMFTLEVIGIVIASDVEIEEDSLVPYKFHHGARHGHRHVRECQPVKYDNVTHETHFCHRDTDESLSVFETEYFVETIGKYWDQRYLHGHHFVINNPFSTVSVLEPLNQGGCEQNIRATVAESAQQKHCILAVNAGFFNTHTGACYGNIVSDGREVQNSGGIQNAHFGITKDGELYFGFISGEEVLYEDFQQLVGGVIWLVRDGENYVDVSKKAECSDTEQTGTIQRFADVFSARTAVGHDKEGRVIIVSIDGQTDVRGLNLYEFADLLIGMGILNAINLDGGGSTTVVQGGVLVNYPSDKCKHNDIDYRCARNVTTILCVHDIECLPKNCTGHGDCIRGNCHCYGNWAGPRCDYLRCDVGNCSGHGTCTEDGCLCSPGWQGRTCTKPCRQGHYGLQCQSQCRCVNGGVCNNEDGSCNCPPGYIGYLCDIECPYGFYGKDCRQLCYCQTSCSCHHVTGNCNISLEGTSLMQAGWCIAREMINEQHLVADTSDDYRLWLVVTVCLSIVAALSIILNISLVCMRCVSRPSYRQANRRKTYRAPVLLDSSSGTCNADDESDLSDDDAIEMEHIRNSIKRPFKK